MTSPVPASQDLRAIQSSYVPAPQPRAHSLVAAPSASKGASTVVVRSSGPESATSSVRESSRVVQAARTNTAPIVRSMPSVPGTARRPSKDARVLPRPGGIPEVLRNKLRKSWSAVRIQRRWRLFCAKRIKQVLMALGESPEIQFVGTREWLQKSGKPLGMSVSAPADQQQWDQRKQVAKRELDHRFLYDFRVAKQNKQPIQVRAAANIPQRMPQYAANMPFANRAANGVGRPMPGYPPNAGLGMQRMSMRVR